MPQIHQSSFIPQLEEFARARNPSWDIKIGGLCLGLTLLNCYYHFLDEREIFFQRIRKVKEIKLDISQDLDKKPYKDLTEEEKVYEHFFNDVYYLQGFLDDTKNYDQTKPAERIQFISDHFIFRDFSSQASCLSSSCFNPKTYYYDQLEKTLSRLFQADADKKKYLLLTTGDHAFGIFYKDQKVFLYDSRHPHQSDPIDFDSENPSSSTEKVVNLIESNLQSFGGPIVLVIHILSNEELVETQRLADSFLQEIESHSLRSGYNSMTPLHLTAKEGLLEETQVLIDRGANINKRDKKGWTPLHHAVQNNHFEIVQFLLDNGAKVDAQRNDDYWTPLHIAARDGYLDIVEKLLKAGANPNPKGRFTPLYIAKQKNHFDIVQMLEVNA